MDVMDAPADEAFLLELLNSTPIIDGIQQDALGTAPAGRAWLREHGGSGTTAEWNAVRAARDELQAVIRGQRPAASIGPLLDGVSYRPAATEDGVQWRLDVPADRATTTRAVLAWDALRRNRPGRLRPCANPECRRFLIDHSKPNKARWCSMAVCGNRMKARRHYERTRQAG